MKNIIVRPYNPQQDLDSLTDLVLAYRVATDVRTYPTVWRIRLLLTSRVWIPERDVKIWEDVTGKIVGFAMLWRRAPTAPYIMLDMFVHPSFTGDELLVAMYEWGSQRGHELATEGKSPLTIYANRFAQMPSADHLLQQAGFVPPPPNPNQYNIYFTKSLSEEIPTPTLPASYTLRPLQGYGDLEAYQMLYGFATVNLDHQKELLESEAYRHFVVAGPDGEFVGYSECSICRAEWQQTGQRIGWLDYIETQPEHRRQGLGRAILFAALGQLQDWGAETVILVTMNMNEPAVHFYEQAGFERVEIAKSPAYRKEIGPAGMV